MTLKKSIGVVASAITAASLLAICVPTAQAAPQSKPVTLSASTGISSSLRTSIDMLDPYVTVSANGWALHAPGAVLAAVPAENLLLLNKSIELSNQLIKSGALIRIDSTSPDGVRQGPMWRVSGPHGYMESHWYGIKIHMDSYLAGKIVAGAGIAAVIAGLGATGPAGPVIAAAFALLAGEISICRSAGGDVNLYYVGPIPGGTLVCNPI